MENINLISSVKHTKVNQNILTINVPGESNNNFKSLNSIIVKFFQNNYNNKSSCFLCNKTIESKTPIDNRNIVEVKCEGLLNCNFCIIPPETKDNIFPGDFVIVQQEDSLDIAQVKLTGELVKFKFCSHGIYNEILPIVIRKCNDEDFERIKKNNIDEERAVPIFKKLIAKHSLEMKLVSVHFQFDRKKLFFFYTADGRVDFRELAKDLAAEFKTRIELRQIGVRDEAKKIGGVGTCGREFCCASFLTSFKKITTQLATEQNLLSNMGKLSGPCGKLKCCISFEI